MIYIMYTIVRLSVLASVNQSSPNDLHFTIPHAFQTANSTEALYNVKLDIIYIHIQNKEKHFIQNHKHTKKTVHNS